MCCIIRKDISLNNIFFKNLTNFVLCLKWINQNQIDQINGFLLKNSFNLLENMFLVLNKSEDTNTCSFCNKFILKLFDIKVTYVYNYTSILFQLVDCLLLNAKNILYIQCVCMKTFSEIINIFVGSEILPNILIIDLSKCFNDTIKDISFNLLYLLRTAYNGSTIYVKVNSSQYTTKLFNYFEEILDESITTMKTESEKIQYYTNFKLINKKKIFELEETIFQMTNNIHIVQ